MYKNRKGKTGKKGKTVLTFSQLLYIHPTLFVSTFYTPEVCFLQHQKKGRSNFSIKKNYVNVFSWSIYNVLIICNCRGCIKRDASCGSISYFHCNSCDNANIYN